MTRSAFELMRYCDGESDSPRQVEELLASDAVARAACEGIEQVGDFLRAYAQVRSESAVDLVDAVMTRVEAGASGSGVASPAAADPARAAPHSGPTPIGRRATRRLTARAAALGSALVAMAAAIALWVSAPRNEAHPEAMSASAVSPTTASAVAVVVEEEAGASIESIDLGDRHGSIFMVTAGSEVTPVVWLSDDNGADEGRMEPL